MVAPLADNSRTQRNLFSGTPCAKKGYPQYEHPPPVGWTVEQDRGLYNGPANNGRASEIVRNQSGHFSSLWIALAVNGAGLRGGRRGVG